MPDLFWHFWRSRNDHHRKMISFVLVSLFVLLLGGMVLFFTKENAPAREGGFKLACRDSDGDNTHAKGAVTYSDIAGKHVDEDSCDVSERAVYEMTCRKARFWSFETVPEKKIVPCPKGCINGACVK